jgi:hypothetical protein
MPAAAQQPPAHVPMPRARQRLRQRRLQQLPHGTPSA